MTHDHRRRILKGLALTLPAAWTTPLVKSVVLPAHAQTSQCAAPAGCYNLVRSDSSIHWPGGTGPHTVILYDRLDCADPLEQVVELVVASSASEASLLLTCPGVVQGAIPTDPPLSGDCHFYSCPID